MQKSRAHKERASLINNPFRQVKEFRIRGFILFSIVMLFSFLVFRKMAIYILLTMACGAFTYFNYYIRLPFDISPVLFLSLIISREYGFLLAVAFILASGIIPMIIAGGNFDHTTLFYLSLIIGVNYLSYILRSYSFLRVMAGLIVFHHFIAMLGAILMGNSPQKEYANLSIKIVLDGIYLLIFSGLVLNLIR